jgi:hypothetical protein
MLTRACYLRRSIDQYIHDQLDETNHLNLSNYRLSRAEWDQVEMLTTILLPFKNTSVKLQKTLRPRIDHVFWSYESLFNNIDDLQAMLARPRNCNKTWAKMLAGAVEQMRLKLSKYYQKTEHPFVYSDAVILEPSGKLLLFEQDSFEPHYKGKYSQECRERYVSSYESRVSEPARSKVTHKRKRAIDEGSSDDNDDYYRALARAQELRGVQNEFDLYLSAPTAQKKKDPLGWWKINAPSYPCLALMFRDTFAVPATGAGVEREFSKSGRVVTPTRARLNHTTVTETMLVKGMLVRQGQELKYRIDDDEKWETDDEGEEEESVEQEHVLKLWQIWVDSHEV